VTLEIAWLVKCGGTRAVGCRPVV